MENSNEALTAQPQLMIFCSGMNANKEVNFQNGETYFEDMICLLNLNMQFNYA